MIAQIHVSCSLAYALWLAYHGLCVDVPLGCITGKDCGKDPMLRSFNWHLLSMPPLLKFSLLGIGKQSRFGPKARDTGCSLGRASCARTRHTTAEGLSTALKQAQPGWIAKPATAIWVQPDNAGRGAGQILAHSALLRPRHSASRLWKQVHLSTKPCIFFLHFF